MLKLSLQQNSLKMNGMGMNHGNQKHNQICGTNLYLNVDKNVPQLILLSDPLHFMCRCFYQSEMNDHNDTGIKKLF